MLLRNGISWWNINELFKKVWVIYKSPTSNQYVPLCQVGIEYSKEIGTFSNLMSCTLGLQVWRETNCKDIIIYLLWRRNEIGRHKLKNSNSCLHFRQGKLMKYETVIHSVWQKIWFPSHGVSYLLESNEKDKGHWKWCWTFYFKPHRHLKYNMKFSEEGTAVITINIDNSYLVFKIKDWHNQ